MPQKVFFGKNSIYKLKNILSPKKSGRIFLVRGKDAYTKSGAKEKFNKILYGFEVTEFFDFKPNPSIIDIKKGIKIFKKNKCKTVIAVGGGSVIDMAKSINIFSKNSLNPILYIKKKEKIKKKGNTLVAIPTTSGSGSEATNFAVVYIEKNKYSLTPENEFLIPDYAIIDPTLTESLPPKITAETGIDAFCQAVESYWSNASTNESKKFAQKAIKLIFKNISKAVNHHDYKSREMMALAAHLSGKAINISQTTACHAISYPITSYFNVPHGQAVFLTLMPIMLFNSQVNEKNILDKRGVKYREKNFDELLKIFKAKNTKEAIKKINRIAEDIGVATKLSEVGIKSKNDIDLIIKNGFNRDRIKNNPKIINKEDLKRILISIQ